MHNQYDDSKVLIAQSDIQLSPEGIDLMKKMLEKDPRNRLSAEQCLQHQWFQTDAEYCQKIIENNAIFAEMKNNGACNKQKDLFENEEMKHQPSSQNLSKKLADISKSTKYSKLNRITGLSSKNLHSFIQKCQNQSTQHLSFDIILQQIVPRNKPLNQLSDGIEEEFQPENEDSRDINQSAQLPDFKGVMKIKDFNLIKDLKGKMSDKNITAYRRVFIENV
ncbi:calcium-dependent protein kinase [Stylonychia lemnae]|uniref:Calcium-dependent protein kinase n=1 Tax=Stylonychia lemnae TaxID=5949 RepID=A0A078B731_STYLE|nr:calcium-dependent protein kinase [Stylonychia lemnae]|eukprot:CDW90001.1 calcium-dependent protein kinase [Stylonychia lemnae]